jgi:DNA-directed RNA polymerase specialized sigma subunit
MRNVAWLALPKPEDELCITILNSLLIRTRVGANGRGREPRTRTVPDWQRNNSSVVLERSEIQRLVAKATEALPKKEPLVLSLYYQEGLNIDEIEAILGINGASISHCTPRRG